MADFKKRKPNPKFMSFKGTAKFPKLNEPDTKFKADGEYSVKLIGRLSDPSVQALIEKLKPLHDAAIAQAETEFAKLPIKSRKNLEAKGVKSPSINPFYGEIYDETTEEATGEVEFKFVTPASSEIKSGKNAGRVWVKRPGLFDAKGRVLVQPIEFKMLDDGERKESFGKKAGPAIWGGSVIKVSFEVPLGPEDAPGYFVPATGACGISLRMLAVQVIELVSGGARNAAGYGFGEEEGYAYDGEASDDDSDETATPAASQDDDGNPDF